MALPKILISGGGIAGPALAYWLNRAGASVTIVERAPSLRSSGQGVDIREAAVQIIQQMGLEADIRRMTTREEGIAFVDSADRERAVFKASGSTQAQSFTSEFEILRGDLAAIFYDVTKDNAKYIFGEYIQGIRQVDKGVEVVFANGAATATFDAVVAADGMGSRLRSLVFGTKSKEYYKPLGHYMSYFTVAEDLLGGSKIARSYNATGGRFIMLRPNSKGQTQAYMGMMTNSDEAISAVTNGVKSQKDLMRKTFHDAGWLSGRVLEGMERADDFYYQGIAQVKMEKWYEGRVAFLGDAGYCPSPFSGMGTSLAIIGGYVLAGEIMNHQDDIPAAFQKYQEALSPYVAQCQKLPPGVPSIVCPQTKTGITIYHLVLAFMSWSRLDRLISGVKELSFIAGKPFVPPKYDW